MKMSPLGYFQDVEIKPERSQENGRGYCFEKARTETVRNSSDGFKNHLILNSGDTILVRIYKVMIKMRSH